MNRADLKRFATSHLKNAQILHRARRYTGAYYLVGYSVECAIKACIAKRTRKYEFPDKNAAIEAYSHDLAKLIKAAGLAPQHQRETGRNASFEVNWTIVKDWSVEARYGHRVDRKRAEDLLTAVTDPADGVLPWLRRYW